MSLHSDDRGVIAPCPACGKPNRLAFDRLSQTARCAKCHVPLAKPAEPVEVGSAAAFDALVRDSSLPVLVDFWAPWCGPCRTVAPQIAEVARRQAGRLVVAKVNTDSVQAVAARLGIQSIPTLAVFARGREASRTSGAMGADQIEAFVQRATA
jgi:thioredoxin 2